jgi:hypothetical protein
VTPTASTILNEKQRRLVLAVAFRDIFFPDPAAALIAVPLAVEVLGIVAWRGDDATYRISVPSGTAVPAPPWAVTVSAPGGEYVQLDPITVPGAPVPSTPPVRSDYLRTFPLLPTRLLRLPPGETAVQGVIRKLGVAQAGLGVTLHPGSVPSAGTPQARTDAAGQFVYRLPDVTGAGLGAAVSLTVTVVAGGVPVTVSPATVTLAAGRVQTLSFERS